VARGSSGFVAIKLGELAGRVQGFGGALRLLLGCIVVRRRAVTARVAFLPARLKRETCWPHNMGEPWGSRSSNERVREGFCGLRIVYRYNRGTNRSRWRQHADWSDRTLTRAHILQYD